MNSISGNNSFNVKYKKLDTEIPFAHTTTARFLWSGVISRIPSLQSHAPNNAVIYTSSSSGTSTPNNLSTGPMDFRTTA